MTPDKRPRSGWLAIGVAAVGVALVQGLDWGSGDNAATASATARQLPAERADSPFADRPVVISADSATPAKPVLAATGPIVVPPPGSGGVPPGMTSAQWRQLNEALRDHPAREVEIARISAYMAFTAQVEQFQTQRTVGASRATLQPLAQKLQVEVAARLERGELPLSEAENLVTELLEVLESDPAEREFALARWRTDHASATAPEPDPREADFVRQQTAAIEAWQALPDDQRDAQQLEAQLKAIRNSLFAPKP